VRELVADLVSEDVEATVQPIVRETVETVSRLLKEGDEDYASAKAIGQGLKLEKGPVSRRIRLAIEAGYLKNLEDRRGKPARLVLGDPMPEDLQILPTVKELMRECFTVSSASEGIEHPLPPKMIRELTSDARARPPYRDSRAWHYP
jgi:hypothetical protein